MGSSLRDTLPAPERPSLADTCGKKLMAHAKPHQPAPVVREAAAEAINRTGTHKGAATDLGLDRSRFTHKLSDGTLTLKELEALGPAFVAKFGEELLERAMPLATPAARLREQIRSIRRAVDELEQGLELLA